MILIMIATKMAAVSSSGYVGGGGEGEWRPA